MSWPMYARVERRACRMQEMMDRLGADAVTLVRQREGEAFAEARTRCLTCINANECLSWLDADPARTEVPAFCPNLPLFEACRKLG